MPPTVAPAPAPTSPPKPRPAPAPSATAARFTRDRVLVARKPSAGDFKAPGEDVRNGVSVVNMIFGPLVTAGQALPMLAKMTFGNPIVDALARLVLTIAEQFGQMPFLRQPLMQAGFKTVARALPFVSAGLLCFDGYATLHTFRSETASGWRKAFTLGRFTCNALATAISFVPGAGFVYALVPSLVGNAFEFAVMRMNAQKQA